MPTWNPTLAVGVNAIDAQHKELFGRADALLEAMKQGRSGDEVLKLLAFLDDYCSRHFACEEKVMREQRYAGYDEHVAQHAIFVKQFQDLVAQFRARGQSPVLTIGLQKLICGWLVQHIGAVDKKLAGALAGKEVRFV
ncbi:bacteriohemerythrin [Anaeromyxobacter paludicola]|uniref:Hemerythrin n=1 Tax=Anaeromyxobacter paludicola TaxID=2918171 RepID=A0ABM7XA59_9BACT|nr:bacteriohemerythrin [Anaeromyxobacter paludicola]BDG08737.1 hemerythrin [Anaeromyxobacter paludicola]